MYDIIKIFANNLQYIIIKWFQSFSLKPLKRFLEFISIFISQTNRSTCDHYNDKTFLLKDHLKLLYDLCEKFWLCFINVYILILSQNGNPSHRISYLHVYAYISFIVSQNSFMVKKIRESTSDQFVYEMSYAKLFFKNCDIDLLYLS